MDQNEFWLQFSDGSKQKLNSFKHGIRKDQVSSNFYNLFDTYDRNNNQTLEFGELEGVFTSLKKYADTDRILSTAEGKNFQSVFAQHIMDNENVDFHGFIKSVSDATENIFSTTETILPDGGKEIVTIYDDGAKETIGYYSDGAYRYKRFEYEYEKTVKTYTSNNNPQNSLNQKDFDSGLRDVYNNYIETLKTSDLSVRNLESNNKLSINIPSFEDFKEEYLINNNIIENKSTKKVEINDFELSERAKSDIDVRKFVFNHYIETQNLTKEALDTMGFLDELGAAINSRAIGTYTDCKNIYNKYFGDGTEEEYNNFYELLQKFSPAHRNKVEDSKLLASSLIGVVQSVVGYCSDSDQENKDGDGDYEKSLMLKSHLKTYDVYPEMYFDNFERDYAEFFGIDYNSADISNFQKTTERYQCATILNHRIKTLDKAIDKIYLYNTQNQMIKYSFDPMAGAANPIEHLIDADKILLEYFDGDKEAKNMFLEGVIDDPIEKIRLLSDLKEQNENQLKTILDDTSYEALELDYKTQFRETYNTEYEPNELLSTIEDAKMTGSMVKIAAITTISVLLSRSPAVVGMTGAAAGSTEASGMTANLIRSLIAKYTRQLGSETAAKQLVQQGIKFAMATNTVATDALFTLFNQVTSERGVNGEELWENTKSAAKYIYFGSYVGGPIANAVSKKIGQVGLTKKLFEGGVKTSQGAIQTTNITGEKLLQNLSKGGNTLLAKGAGFATDVALFTGLEVATEDANLIDAFSEQSEMLGKLKVMNGFIEYMLGAKTHSSINKARWNSAIEKSGVKNWNIKEIKIPTEDGKTTKNVYEVDVDGIPIGRYGDLNVLTTSIIEKVSSVYANTKVVDTNFTTKPVETNAGRTNLANLNDYIFDKANYAKIINDRQIWTPKENGSPSINSVASYLASKRGGSAKNGYVILVDDIFVKEYNSNKDFKLELEQHLENNPNTVLYDFRTNKTSSFEVSGKALEPLPTDVNINGGSSTLVRKDGKLTEKAVAEVDKLVSEKISDPETRTLVQEFLKENIVVDTFESEIQLMHNVCKQIEQKGIKVHDENTYFFIPRDMHNSPKSCDRIGVTFAIEMGIEPSHLVTDVSKLPKGSNVVLLDDFAGSGNSLIEFSGIISKQGIKSITIAPLTSTQGSKCFWNNQGVFDLAKLLDTWKSTENKSEVVNQIQATEALTLLQKLKDPSITSTTKATIEEILRESCRAKNLKPDIIENTFSNIANIPELNYTTSRSVTNIFASDYYNKLTPENQVKLLNGLGFSSVISLLGYGKSGTTYVGPVMATNTNVGIMYSISDIFGVKSKNIDAMKINGIRFQASDFDNFVQQTPNTGIFAVEGDVMKGTKNYLEYNNKQYQLTSKTSVRKYKDANSVEYVISQTPSGAKVYKCNPDGSTEYVQDIKTDLKDAIVLKDAQNKKLPLKAIESSVTVLEYNNDGHILDIYMSGDNVSITSNDGYVPHIRKIETNGNKVMFQID